MKLSSLSFDGIPLNFPYDPEIGNISSVSSKCKRGSLFICIEGLHSNGHAYIDEALSRGALGIVIDEKYSKSISINKDIPIISYKNTRVAEAFLTSRFYGNPADKMKLIAVTGTNGKTTVTSMLQAIFSASGKRTASIGTLTGRMTTPDPEELYKRLYELYKDGTEYVFMEASSHALSLHKLDPISFDHGIFTNLTEEHLDFHHTMEEYAVAKARLFSLSKNAILNADDPYAQRMASFADKVYYCSTLYEGYDMTAMNIVLNGSYGIKYDLAAKDLIFKIRCPIPGRFTVSNTLLSASCALLCRIPHEIIRSALGGFSGVSGRLERVGLPTNDFTVYIDFAHTPDALENILRTVRSFLPTGSRLMHLFGCGGDRDKLKRPIMGEISTRLADFSIITSDNSRSESTSSIISEIVSGIGSGGNYTVIENRKDAIEFAVENAKQGDIILLTGKGHEQYELISGTLTPFSEKDIVINSAYKYIKSRGLY